MSDKVTGYKINLNSSSDLKRLLSKIASEVYTGKIDVKVANSIVGISNSFLSLIKTTELEKKLNDIETILEERGIQI